MLQQANRQMGQVGLLSVQEPTSKITPSLAALDNAQALRRREWRRGEPGEDVTPEGSLSDLPAAIGGASGSRRKQ